MLASTGCDVHDFGDVDYQPSLEEGTVKNVRNMKNVIAFNEKVRHTAKSYALVLKYT